MALNSDIPSRIWRYRFIAGALIIVITLLRLLYLACACPYDLAPDEAHYWDWSRHLDWSYYSKGPLVAWLIRGSCELFGTLAQLLTGSEMLAVRLPAVLCGGLLLLGLYALTVQVLHSDKLALAVIAIAIVLPVFSVGAILMTIDAPYACCWSWALVTGYRAAFHDEKWAWACSGLLIGLGILAKYTMVLWLPSFALFLLASSAHRHLLLRSGFWIMLALSGLCCLPIVIWNVQHEWVTLLHMRTHAGWSHGVEVHWLGPLAFLGGQFLILLGYWFVVWLGAMWHFRPGTGTPPQLGFLWWMSAPLFVFFLLFSLQNGGGELNWPLLAYLAGLPLGSVWLTQRLKFAVGVSRLLQAATLLAFCLLPLAGTIVLHRLDWLRPMLVTFAGPPTAERPFPSRRWDPSARLCGWHTLAREVDRLRVSCRRAGIEPVVAVAYWNMAGELGFYCQGHPSVYSLGPAFGDRHSQYDFWHPNPISERDDFYGSTFIIVGNVTPALAGNFDSVEPVRTLVYTEHDTPLAGWTITVAHGFRGINAAAHDRY